MRHEDSTPQVGYIGLGLMGFAMANRLIRAKFELALHTRTAQKAQPLIEAGGVYHLTVEALANAARGGVIFLCLTDSHAVASVCEQLCQGDLDGTLLVDMGTTSVAQTQHCAAQVSAQGGAWLDAPVSGGQVGAEQGTLSIMVGGDSHDLARATPYFAHLGQTVTHIGPTGAGQAAKTANQMIVGSTLNIVAEALLLAERAGANPAKVREALLGGFAGSRILDLHGQRMIDRQFQPGGRISTQRKDLDQAVELCEQLGLTLPLLAEAKSLWHQACEGGYGELDQSGIYQWLVHRNEE
ncbi:MAG: NAD(P)-dependent oxidoreductase [Gammaproteobacteria bacterium]|nr:NAD(P)-dependent oxidoreductase [Gammaproteobacteria bacterium]